MPPPDQHSRTGRTLTVVGKTASPTFTDSAHAAAIAVWAEQILGEVRRLAMRKFYFTEMDADDVASEVVVGFLADPAAHMTNYDNPHHYARTCFPKRSYNWQRTQRVQRCQRGELTLATDGSQRPARDIISLDTPLDDEAATSLVDILVATDDVEAEAIGRRSDQMAITAALDVLPATDRALLKAVYLTDREPAEIRSELGCTELAYRQRLSRARRTFRNSYIQAAARQQVAVLEAVS